MGGRRESFERLSGEQPGSCICCPSWKDGVFTGSGTFSFSYGRRRELQELPSCGITCFMPATIQVEKHN